MSRLGASPVIRLLMAAVALLLPAGVVVATQLDPGPAVSVAADGRAAAVGLSQADVLEEQARTRATVVTIAPDAAPPTMTATPTTTASVEPPAPTTTSPPRNGPTTSLPPVSSRNTPAASSWQGAAPGVSAHMRIEPTAPVAGQPVRIHLDFSGVDACCYVFLHFGDGSEAFALNNTWMCQGVSPLTPGTHRAVVTHTYAAPGAYRAFLQVMDGDLCTLPPSPPPDGPMPLHHVDIHACIAVGPGTAATDGCAPLPAGPWGPT